MVKEFELICPICKKDISYKLHGALYWHTNETIIKVVREEIKKQAKRIAAYICLLGILIISAAVFG